MLSKKRKIMQIVILIIFLLLGGLILNGCAILVGEAITAVETALPEEDMRAKSMDVPSGKALIYIYRDESFRFLIRPIVTVNNNNLGPTGQFTFYLVESSPGTATITSTVVEDNHTSKITIDLQSGRKYYVWQEMKASGFVKTITNLQEVSEELGTEGVSKCRLIKFVQTLDSSRVSAVGERSKRAEIKEFIILEYNNIMTDLSKGEGEYLESVVRMLEIESVSRYETIDKIRKLSEVYTVIPEFADKTIDLYAEGVE